MTYIPGNARVGEPTPQSHPARFTDGEIMAEVKYLIAANKRYGSNTLRTLAYLKLMRFVSDRRAKSHAASN